MFVIATVKESLNPENSIHQGQLVTFRIKNGKCDFHLLNPDNKCEHFIIIHISNNNWSIVSLHDDGSLVFSTLFKVNKAQIESEKQRI